MSPDIAIGTAKYSNTTAGGSSDVSQKLRQKPMMVKTPNAGFVSNFHGFADPRRKHVQRVTHARKVTPAQRVVSPIQSVRQDPERTAW